MNVLLYKFLFIFAKFIFYSCIGWIIELIVTYVKKGKVINRGFLVGPWIPMYGFCALMLVYCFKGETNPIYIFVFSCLIASIFEYLTSYFMEKIFKARWWDYSSRPFNINGRVYLVNSLGFGILGFALIELIDPKLSFLLSSFDPFYFSIFNGFILFLFIFDIIISFNIIKHIKLTAECVKKDYTEEITKKVRKTLYDKSNAFKRIFDAFPNVLVFNKNYKRKKK